MPFVVKKVLPNTPAAAGGAHAGDVLAAVNGVSVLHATSHADLDAALERGRIKSGGKTTVFSLHRGRAAPAGSVACVVRGSRLGASLWEKVDNDESQCRGGVYITDISEGNAAAKAITQSQQQQQQLQQQTNRGPRMWDTLVAVDGRSLRGLDLDEVGNVVASLPPGDEGREWIIERHPGGNPTNVPHEVIVTRSEPGQISGMSFNTKLGGGNDLFVDHVESNGRAQHDGVLLGDQLLSVSGVDVRGAGIDRLLDVVQGLPPDQMKEFVVARPKSTPDIDFRVSELFVESAPGQSMGIEIDFQKSYKAAEPPRAKDGAVGNSGGGSGTGTGKKNSATGESSRTRLGEITIDTARASPSSGRGVAEGRRDSVATSPAGMQVFEKKYSKKLHRAMFNTLLRQKIAEATEFISFAGFVRHYDPVLEQFVFVNRATGEVKSCFLAPDTNKLCFYNHRTKGTEVTERVIQPPDDSLVANAVARKREHDARAGGGHAAAAPGSDDASSAMEAGNASTEAASPFGTRFASTAPFHEGAGSESPSAAPPRTPKRAGSLAPLIDLHIAAAQKKQSPSHQRRQQLRQNGAGASGGVPFVKPTYSSPRRRVGPPDFTPEFASAQNSTGTYSPSRTSDKEKSTAEFSSAYNRLKSLLGRSADQSQ